MSHQNWRIGNAFAGRLLALTALLTGAMVGFGSPAMSDPVGSFTLVDLVPVTISALNKQGGLYVFDIADVDQSTDLYYLADRSNAVVDVVDTNTGQFIKQIHASPEFAGFTGSNDKSGPNGVVAAFPWLFVTDAPSRVVTIDLRTGATVSDVSTGGATGLRADELAYAPEIGTLLVINNADDPPFGTLITVDKTTGKLTVGKKITFDSAHGVDATDGAEQPQWHPLLQRFFLSIPKIGSAAANGGVAVIDPNTATVERVIDVNFCSPAGLAIGPIDKGEALIGCNKVFDTGGSIWSPTGTNAADPRDVIINLPLGFVVRDVFGAGAGDEVTYNARDNNYYASGSGSPRRPLPAATASGTTPAAVIDGKLKAVVGDLSTYNVAATTTGTIHPAGTSHSIATDRNNGRVLVAIPANNAMLSPDGNHNCLFGCIAIWGRTPKDVVPTD